MLDLFQRYLWPSLTRLDDQIEGRERSVTVIGDRPSTRFFSERFLSETADRRELGHLPMLSLPGRLARLCEESDLVIGRVPMPVSRAAGHRNAVSTPLMVQPKLRLPITEARRSRIRKRQKDNLRKIRKHGLSYSISSRPGDFEEFVDRFYLPFVSGRFESRVGIMPRAKLKRYFRRGGIMWILQDDKRVAGELFANRGRVLKSVVAGIADGDRQHVELGALSATYHFMSQWAEQRGFRQLDWGACDPSLANGILTTKKRWGAELHCDAFQRFELFFSWRQFGPEIRQFLNTTPLIIWYRGELTGLVATASDQPANTEEIHSLVSRHWIDGLQRIIVIAGGDAPDRGGQSKSTDSLVWLAHPGTPRECLESARPARELQLAGLTA